MGVKGLFPSLVVGVVLWPITATLTAPVGHAQSVAVREESVTGVRQPLITLSAKDTPLAKILRDIAAQADLEVAFPGLISRNPARVTITVHGMPLDQVLARVLDGTGVKAIVASGMIVFKEDTGAAKASVAQGSITGKVIDGKSRQGLRGATITISGTNEGTTSGDDGRFRFSHIVPGSYTIQVRMLGYVKVSKAVTLADGQTVSIDVTLEQSVSALDQVIVTGTVIPTAQKAVPNAMTIITAKDIEARGVTRIQQLFRGDVPGLFVENTQSNNAFDSVNVYSRGTTALSIASQGTQRSTNPIKTYVDGVELANPSYLGQIDPSSIERIEILTGPQASTIYGSNAINGVIQVFTKRGTMMRRPQLTIALHGGWVENNFRTARTPQHDDQVQVQGVEGHVAYNVGGSWNYVGPWTPTKQTQRVSGFGGARLQEGLVTVDGSLRLATTRNARRDDGTQPQTAYQETGWYRLSGSSRSAPMIMMLRGQTLGLTLGYTPLPGWSHEAMLGRDQSATETRTYAAALSRPGDSLLVYTQAPSSRTSWRYATSLQTAMRSGIKGVVTLGGDGWTSTRTSLSVSSNALTGTLNGTTTVSRNADHNAGGFVQAQIELAEHLFLTYGLRAEWSPGFGENAQPNLAPRYGASYVRDLSTPVGTMTVKMRASYGRSTRPPLSSYKKDKRLSEFGGGFATDMVYYGDAVYFLANPDIGPEFQQGGEGGIELYFGKRGSVVLTRYNQTVDGLIDAPIVDSVRSIIPGVPSGWYRSQDEEGYGYMSQMEYMNIGAIRNQGWEGQGTINVGPFAATGTYSWTKSRVIGITPKYRNAWAGVQNPLMPGSSFSYLPEHTWAMGIRYTNRQTSIAINATGLGQLSSYRDSRYYECAVSSVRLSVNRCRMVITAWNDMGSGYMMMDLDATHRLSATVEGLLQVRNMTDYYRSDVAPYYATLGRQSKIGLRIRL